MPDKQKHQIAGACYGSAFAGIWSIRETGSIDPTIIAGGLLGGILGAAIPDSLDPPDSPRHRGFGHSLLAAGAICGICADTISNLTTFAEEEQRRFDACIELGYQYPLLNGIRLQAALLLIGVVVGLPAGVISHLILDNRSPDGIRLFNRQI